MESTCLLGVIDDEIENDSSTSQTSKIGGRPIWLTIPVDVNCNICSTKSVFIAQIYCPIGDSIYNRTLYIFACPNKSCWMKSDSWTVIRQMKEDVTYQRIEEAPVFNDNTDWCDSADDWGMADDTANTNKSNTNEAEKATQHEEGVEEKEKEEEKRDISECIQNLNISSNNYEKSHITPRYIYVTEEVDKSQQNPVNLQHEKALLTKYALIDSLDQDKGSRSKSSGSASENYEKCQPKYGDKHLIKFYKYISRLPEQIIRYCYGGEAIQMQEYTSNANCKHCGKELIFEVQLMPALVQFIEIEFGTVLLYTCSDNCYSSNYVLEYVIVQNDVDDQKLRDYENKRL